MDGSKVYKVELENKGEEPRRLTIGLNLILCMGDFAKNTKNAIVFDVGTDYVVVKNLKNNMEAIVYLANSKIEVDANKISKNNLNYGNYRANLLKISTMWTL